MNNAFKIKVGQNLAPQSGSVVTTEGDIAFNHSTEQLEVFTTGVESITTATNTQTLTGKSIDGGSNTITGVTASSVAASAITGTTLASNVVNSSLTAFGNSPVLVTPNLGTPSAVVLTNATGTASSLTAGNINATSNATLTTLSALVSVSTITTGVWNAGAVTSTGQIKTTNIGDPQILIAPSTTTNSASIGFQNAGNTTGGAFVGVESSVGGTNFAGSTAYATLIGNAAAVPIQFFTNNTKALTIDSSQNATFVGTTTANSGSLVTKNGSGSYSNFSINNTNAAGFSQLQFNIGSSGGSGQANINYAPGTFFLLGPTANDATTPVKIVTNNGTTAATFDTSQNAMFAQQVGINVGPSSNAWLNIGSGSGSLTGTSNYGITVNAYGNSSATSALAGIYAAVISKASTATTNVYGQWIDTLTVGSGATATNYYGLYLAGDKPTGVSNPYALYSSGTAPSQLGGALTVNSNITNSGAVSTQSYDTSTATSGTITASANKPGLSITGAGGTTLTIKLPSSPIDGQQYWVASAGNFTTVTWQDSGGTAGNVVGGNASLGGTAGGQRFVYIGGQTKWYRI